MILSLAVLGLGLALLTSFAAFGLYRKGIEREIPFYSAAGLLRDGEGFNNRGVDAVGLEPTTSAL
jgi:hypothetical protein